MNDFNFELFGIFGHKTAPEGNGLMSNFQPPKTWGYAMGLYRLSCGLPFEKPALDQHFLFLESNISPHKKCQSKNYPQPLTQPTS